MNQQICAPIWRDSTNQARYSYREPTRGHERGGKGFKHNIGRLIQGHHPSDLIAFQKLMGQPTAEDGVAVNDRDLDTYASVGI